MDELSKLHKERRKHQLALQTGRPEKRRSGKERDGKRKRRKGSGSDSDSGSSGSDSGGSSSDSGSGSSASESESEEERGRRKGGKRRRSRSRSKERSGKRGRKEKQGSKEKKRGSKEKKKKREKEKRSKRERREKDKAKAKVGGWVGWRGGLIYAGGVGMGGLVGGVVRWGLCRWTAAGWVKEWLVNARVCGWGSELAAAARDQPLVAWLSDRRAAHKASRVALGPMLLCPPPFDCCPVFVDRPYWPGVRQMRNTCNSPALLNSVKSNLALMQTGPIGLEYGKYDSTCAVLHPSYCSL